MKRRSWFLLAVVVLLPLQQLPADHLVLSRAALVKETPTSDGVTITRYEAGTAMQIRGDGAKTNGYYPVRDPTSHRDGWVYKTLGRRFTGDLPPQPGTDLLPPELLALQADDDALYVCTFNVMFLGHYTRRDAGALAAILRPFDVVVVQELVAPPNAGTFPDGTPFAPDAEAAAFFDAMGELGFAFVLSEEDTGTNDTIHTNTTATEWFVAFFNPDTVFPLDEHRGSLADDRSNHPDFERVPYAFPFRDVAGTLDFVLVSVHLQPGPSTADRARRRHELAAIATWVNTQPGPERDFLVLGDMNLENGAELASALPAGFTALNDEMRATNTNVHGPKPYDHVFHRPANTQELDEGFDCLVLDLRTLMLPFWTHAAPYPGDPYDHNAFKQVYSDHNPVVFRLELQEEDDD